MKPFMLILVVVACFAVDDQVSKESQTAIDRSIEGNLNKAYKSYDAYLKELEIAKIVVVKDLEKMKAEAMKKGDLAHANIVEAKIKEVKDGALGDRIVERSKSVDLLGDSDGWIERLDGKWIRNADHKAFEFKNGIASLDGESEKPKVIYDKKTRLFVIAWTKYAPEKYKVADRDTLVREDGVQLTRVKN